MPLCIATCSGQGVQKLGQSFSVCNWATSSLKNMLSLHISTWLYIEWAGQCPVYASAQVCRCGGASPRLLHWQTPTEIRMIKHVSPKCHKYLCTLVYNLVSPDGDLLAFQQRAILKDDSLATFQDWSVNIGRCGRSWFINWCIVAYPSGWERGWTN